MAEIDSGVWQAGGRVEGGQESIREVGRQSQQLSVVYQTVAPEDSLLAAAYLLFRVISTNGQVSHSKLVRAQQATHAADGRLEDLHLAVQVKAPCPLPLSAGSFRPVSVVLDQRLDAVLEVVEGLVAPVLVAAMLVRQRRRGEDGEGGQTVDEGQGVVAQDVVHFDVGGVLAVACEGPAGQWAQLVLGEGMGHVAVEAMVEDVACLLSANNVNTPHRLRK